MAACRNYTLLTMKLFSLADHLWLLVHTQKEEEEVLGPLLFIISVNDLPAWIKQGMRMFADDTKIWIKISGLNDIVLCLLQANFNQLGGLEHWSDKWLVRFNSDKWKVVHIGHVCRFRTNSAFHLSVQKQRRRQ